MSETPRLQPIEPPYVPEVQASFDAIMRGRPPLLLFRTVAHNPRVLQRMIAGGLLDKGSVSMRVRELMILRTCALCRAESEWGVHVATFGAKCGWTADQIRSSVRGGAPTHAGATRSASCCGSRTHCTPRAQSTTRCGTTRRRSSSLPSSSSS